MVGCCQLHAVLLMDRESARESVIEMIKKALRVFLMPISGMYLILLILIIGFLLYFFFPRIESFFIFLPETHLDATPDERTMGYKEVYFPSEDGERLHGWFFPLKGECPVILFCHGNAGNISHRLENVRLLLREKLQVFLFDYRGYGRSSGTPSERGIYLDGLAAYDYLVEKERIPRANIIPFGRSLGAAVAIEISLKREAKSLITESAFTSTRDVARTTALFFPVSYLLPAHYNNLKKIGRVAVPKLIIHGKADEIIPFSMGLMLFEAAEAPKYFLPLEGAGHNDTFIVGGRSYFEAFARFAYSSAL
jgi:fermentation-respiration switch protein FrsA (DUF1100 family)